MRAGQTAHGNRLRARLTNKFINDLIADYEQFGAAAIKTMRMEQPTKYVLMLASLCLKEIGLDITENRVSELSDEQIATLVDSIQQMAIMLKRRAGQRNSDFSRRINYPRVYY